MDDKQLNIEKNSLIRQINILMDEWISLDENNSAVCILMHENEKTDKLESTASFKYNDINSVIPSCAAAIHSSPTLNMAAEVAMLVQVTK